MDHVGRDSTVDIFDLYEKSGKLDETKTKTHIPILLMLNIIAVY